MYPVSQKFKDAIYAPIRRTTGRVTFDISDLTATGDVSSIVTTSESPLSVKSQLINKVRTSSNKNATLEQDRFKLDGTFSFPDDTITNNGELGWSSAEICTDDGIFENLLGTDGSCESLTPFAWVSSGGSSTSTSTTRVRSGSNSLKSIAVGSTSYAYKDYATTLDTNKMYLLAGWTFVESYVSGTLQISLRDISTTNSRYTAIASPTKVGVWQFVYVKVPKNNTLVGSGYRLLFGNTGSASGVVYFDELRLYEISQDTYDKIGVDAAYTGDALADKFGYLENPPSITFNFTSNHSSAGLTVTFDQSTGEYATDFDMTAYDASNAVIDTVSVTGNTDIIATPLGQLYNYRKVSVTIKKWSVPYRRARVFEVDFGIVKQYGDEGLIQMNLIEEMDMLTSRVPSPEFKFTVDNVDRAFNILNPTGFYKYLQQKQQVIAEIGLEVTPNVFEYVTLGTYYLQEWKSNEGSITASFTARTNLDFTASFDYENLSASTKTLYQFAVDIFTLCGITNYSIDSALLAINTNSLVKKTNCRNILQMIAIAGCARIYVTRDNVITLKCNRTRKVRYIRDYAYPATVDTTGSHWVEIQALNTSGTNVALGKTVTPSSPIYLPATRPVSLVTDGDTTAVNWAGIITGLKTESMTVDLGAVYDISDVKVWHYYGDGRTYRNTKTEISEDGVTWTTVFDSAVSGEYAETSTGRTYSLETVMTPLVPIDTIDFDNAYDEPQITLDQAIKRVEVTHWSNLSTSAIVGVNSTTDTLGDTIKLENNTLINDSTRATAVANWIMSQVKYKATYRVSWRGNPATELNDIMDFENSYGADTNAYVTRYELDYAGYLTARTQAKGAVN